MSRGIAAVLSFFIPGLGQLFQGRLLAAVFYFFGTIIGLAFCTVPGIIVWLVGIVSALSYTRKG